MSKAFQTPEILKLFALKQPAQLRERLSTLQRDHKLGKVTAAAYVAEAVEILTALKKLGGELSAVRIAVSTPSSGGGGADERVVWFSASCDALYSFHFHFPGKGEGGGRSHFKIIQSASGWVMRFHVPSVA